MSEAPDNRFETRYEAHFGDRMVRCFAHRPHSVAQLLDQALATNADGEALVFGDERVSYRVLDARAQSVAANLQRHGIQAGERIALLLRNGLEFVYGVLAAARLGAIVVPLNVRERGEGLAFILENCGARVLIAEADLLDRLPTRERLTSLTHVFAVGAESADAAAFASLLEEPAQSLRPAAVAEEDTAVILYTSGTTGQPKGAMLTHLNIVHSVMHFEQCMQLGAGERSVMAVPASHVTGLVAILLTMIRVAGCTVIMREFKAEAFNAFAAKERITHALMVPAMYNLCLLRADFDSLDLSAWRIGGFGGAPMPEATIARFHEKLPNLGLMNAYGATETTSPTTAMPPRYAHSHRDSVGRVLPCAEVRVMDTQGREVPAGTAGELWIAGPMVVPGYWGNPKATQESFMAGYWRSGDVGSVDAEGFVRLHDRMKDMIIRGGYNIYSAELENTISHLPGVVECAVVAHPDPVLGEKIHAFVSTEREDFTGDEVKAFCAEHLADYKVPDFVTVQREPLPRNANGKLIKRDLRGRLDADAG
jgi:long-chain acyl-CoA synthetase